MIPRVEAPGFGWAADVWHMPPRRPRVQATAIAHVPRDLTDRIVLSPAALRLLDQTERLRDLRSGSAA